MDVTVSDYPDDLLISLLSQNVLVNGVESSCRVVAHSWGTDPAPLLANHATGFDFVIAADTLWNSSLHSAFIKTLRTTLGRSASARVHLVAGLHTGRYTIESFLNMTRSAGFELESANEMETKGCSIRPWCIDKDIDNDESRKWIVWIVLRWKL